jgi:hypothetical protein
MAQEMPPRGGFPFTRFARNIPRKGFHGATLWAILIGVSSYGIYNKFENTALENIIRGRR